MTAKAKILLILVGYVAAFALACLAVMLGHMGSTEAERSAASGMSAFGDTLLFLGVFGLSATAVSIIGILMLRGHPAFWRILGVAVLLVLGLLVLAGSVLFML